MPEGFATTWGFLVFGIYWGADDTEWKKPDILLTNLLSLAAIQSHEMYLCGGFSF